MHLARQESRDEDLFVTMALATQPVAVVDDSLDDVFGSDNDSPVFGGSHDGADGRDSHPSDVRRLQTEHATAGYREGITAAKAQSIQAGFDEGFSLAATIGLKAGELLGYLEGIAAALRAVGGDDHKQACQLLADAREKLSTTMIFDEQYWNPDGTWKYHVAPAADSGSDKDIIFEDVASSHPLISSWTRTVDDQIKKWNINRGILDAPEEEPMSLAQGKKDIKIDQPAREALDW